MKDDGTRLEIYGKVITGWMATLIVLLMLGGLVGLGFYAGWQAGVRHVCDERAA
jgi:hypothetical protein